MQNIPELSIRKHNLFIIFEEGIVSTFLHKDLKVDLSGTKKTTKTSENIALG